MYSVFENVFSIRECIRVFENDMYDLVKNVKFKHNVSSPLQTTLKQNMRDMSEENRMYVAADKTSTFYKITKEKHKQMMHQNVTKEYKKCDDKVVDKVNSEDKKIAEELELDERIYAFSKRDAFITVKDHKDNFQNNTKCRLINPAKSDLGKVSKKILSRVVTALRKSSNLNQWKNPFAVIDWFKELENKDTLTFLLFDIVEYYPNITEELLKKALNYAKNHVDITKEEIKIILQTKKALLFSDGKPWVKKGHNNFDVTMGS